MGRVARFLVVACMFFHVQASAFIYDLVVMRVANGAEYKYFIGLSDFHDKKHPANDTQLAELRSLLATCPPEKIKIVSEDIGSPGVNHDGQCGRFFVISEGGVLNGFAALCKELGLHFDNFEYRYCRVAALGPVLHNINFKPGQFASVATTRVSALVEEIQAILGELNRYNDRPLLKDLYAASKTRMHKLMNELHLFEHADRTVEQYLAAVTTDQNRLAFVKKLLTFDSVLFDLRVLHSILQNKTDVDLLLAGGSHVTRVAKLLAKFGYKYVQVGKPGFTKEYNLKNCVGNHVVDGQYCEQPKPIDIRVIKDFLSDSP